MNETPQPTTAPEPRKGFVFYLSWAECLAELRPTERAAVYDALVSYAQTGETPPLQGKCKMALAFILHDFERADDRYRQIIERRRAAGRMGGAPRGNQNAAKTSENNQKQAKTSKTSKTSIDVDVDDDDDVDVDVDVDVDDVKVGRADASLESVADAPTTDQRRKSFYETLKPYADRVPVATLLDFFNYWSEPTPDGRKMRYELERTWSLTNRLRAWQSREPAKGRASPAMQREADAAERERAYQQRLAREEARREAKQEQQRNKCISYEEYLRSKEGAD